MDMEIEMAEAKTQDREVLFALEGDRKPRSLVFSAQATVAEFLELVKFTTGRAELEEILIEDDEVALGGHQILVERIVVDEFKLVHVATKGKIEVGVIFNGKTERHEFGPNATMEKVIKQAMAAFRLEGDPSDFQLKLGADLLPAGDHVGQVADGKKTLRLALVMKIKPQG